MFLDRYPNREPSICVSGRVSSITGCRVGARDRGSQRGCGGGIFSDRGNSLPGGIRDTGPLRTVNSRQDWPMARGSAQLTFKTLRHVSKPFCFLSARYEPAILTGTVRIAHGVPTSVGAGEQNQKQNTVTLPAQSAGELKPRRRGRINLG